MIQIYTYGCKVNTYDSGLLEEQLKKNVDESLFKSGIHIFNTCAVTSKATQDTIKVIKKLKQSSPEAFIIVTGCGAQVDTGLYENLAEVDLVIGNSHKWEIPQILTDFFNKTKSQKIHRTLIFKKNDLAMGGGTEKNHTRAFVKIQDGCNSFCSYCVIPYSRGISRSLPSKYLIQKIQELESKGFLEVVLTGIHIGDYKDPDQTDFHLERLIENILEHTHQMRIRLTSLEPPELSQGLLKLFEHQRVCPHFHMSIQSASDVVLKDMKRKYSAQQVKETLHQIHQHIPKAFVGMDLIVGFPTETREEFDKTYEVLKSAPWHRIHVFPYSVRPGTLAATLQSCVSREEIIDRAHKMRELSTYRFQLCGTQQVTTVKDVLFLKDKKGIQRGLSSDFWSVELEKKIHTSLRGQIHSVQIIAFEKSKKSSIDGHLKGVLLT